MQSNHLIQPVNIVLINSRRDVDVFSSGDMQAIDARYYIIKCPSAIRMHAFLIIWFLATIKWNTDSDLGVLSQIFSHFVSNLCAVSDE